jgi:WD40 repeat protein
VGEPTGRIRRWDPTTGQPVLISFGHDDGNIIRALVAARGPAGRPVLVAGHLDGTWRRWDLETGRQIGRDARANDSVVYALVTVRDHAGRDQVFSASGDGTLRRLDPAGRRWIGRGMPVDRGGLTALAALTLPGGRALVAAGGLLGSLTLVDITANRVVAGLPGAHMGHLFSLVTVTGEDGRVLLVSSGADSVIRRWQVPSLEPMGEQLRGHSDYVRALSTITSPDGEVLIASAADDGTVRFWDPWTGRPTGVPVREDAGRITSLAAIDYPDGRRLLAAADRKRVRLLGPTTPTSRADAQDWGLSAAVASTPDGPVIFAGGGDGIVRLWDGELRRITMRKGRPVELEHSRLLDPRPLPAGVPLLTEGPNRVRDAFGRPFELAWTDTEIIALAAANLPGGRLLLASGTLDGLVKVWRLALLPSVRPQGTATRLNTVDRSAITRSGHVSRFTGLRCLSFIARSPTDVRLLCGYSDGRIGVWDVANGRNLRFLRGHEGDVEALSTVGAGAGARVVSGGADGTIRVWELGGSRSVGTLRGHEGGVSALSTVGAGAGARVVSGGADGTVRMWELGESRAVRVLGSHDGSVTALTAGGPPDGTRIVSAGADGMIRTWDPADEARTGRIAVGGPIRSLGAVNQRVVVANLRGLVLLDLDVDPGLPLPRRPDEPGTMRS